MSEKKIVVSPHILAHGKRVDRSQRARVLEAVLRAWWKWDPVGAKAAMHFLTEITKVEHNSGAWRSGEGYVKLRIPTDLLLYCRAAFNRVLPDQPGFCQHGDMGDDDIRLLYEIAPKLMGARKRKRKM